jgi:hypothetical protein
MENISSSLRKNPSRENCEQTIRRILTTELLENGKNEHFRSAADFMSYFESLYPASDALTKQVQRAVRSLNMPKDDRGYFIPNKTKDQVSHERELHAILNKAGAGTLPLDRCDPLFLKADPRFVTYLISEIKDSELFSGKYEAIVPCSDGILFYTKNISQLSVLLDSLIAD